MKVRFVGVNGPVVVPDLGGQVINPGDVIDVPDVLGGRMPAARLLDCMAEIHDAIGRIDHHGAAALREELATLDTGSGLLAQAENWQPVNPKTTKKEAPDAA